MLDRLLRIGCSQHVGVSHILDRSVIVYNWAISELPDMRRKLLGTTPVQHRIIDPEFLYILCEGLEFLLVVWDNIPQLVWPPVASRHRVAILVHRIPHRLTSVGSYWHPGS
jgi:hypothetical protein